MGLLDQPGITQNVRDNLGDESGIMPILKRFERFDLELAATSVLIYTRDTTTDSVWDRDLWDVMLWDDTYDQPLAIQRVINPDYIYREYFMQDYFNDTGVTTANWNTTTNQLEFDLGEIAQSLPIALNSETYSNATITLTGTNLTNLSLKLSSDGGVNFESVSNNTNHVFTNVSIAGIKFKIEATGGSAEIESIIITYGI